MHLIFQIRNVIFFFQKLKTYSKIKWSESSLSFICWCIKSWSRMCAQTGRWKKCFTLCVISFLKFKRLWEKKIMLCLIMKLNIKRAPLMLKLICYSGHLFQKICHTIYISLIIECLAIADVLDKFYQHLHG